MPRAAAKTPAKPKKKPAAKKRAPRKPTPVKQDTALAGPKPLSKFDFDFCHLFVQTNKQVDAWRQLRPDDADPHKAAHRMMQRPEIREHIKDIFRKIAGQRSKAAEVSARASLLSLELADDRLVEILQQPRKTRAEMLSRDVKSLLVRAPGDWPEDGEDDDENELKKGAMNKALLEHLDSPAPVEDADLLKAIKTAYDRKQGIIKADKNPAPTHTTVMLYKPKWFGQARTIEAVDAS